MKVFIAAMLLVALSGGAAFGQAISTTIYDCRTAAVAANAEVVTLDIETETGELVVDPVTGGVALGGMGVAGAEVLQDLNLAGVGQLVEGGHHVVDLAAKGPGARRSSACGRGDGFG